MNVNKKYSANQIKQLLPLWPHQNSAIGVIDKYIKAFRKSTTHDSCLIHMPTGTGKSGIITVISGLLKSVSKIMVLTPRVALRNQLFNDINGRFLNKLNTSINTVNAEVKNIIDKWSIPKSPVNYIHVSTI